MCSSDLEKGDKKKLDQHFTKLDRNRKRVEGDLKEPFALVNQLNTIGSYRRNRTDRSIAKDAGNSKENLAAQRERDRDNTDWIIQACDEALVIFREAHERVTQRAKRESRSPDIQINANASAKPSRKIATPAA